MACAPRDKTVELENWGNILEELFSISIGRNDVQSTVPWGPA
jgi:hypothetical protein